MKIPEFGTLQMTRTNPAHFGTGAVQNLSAIPHSTNGSTVNTSFENRNNVAASSVSSSSAGNSFKDALNMLNQQQLDVADVQKKLITDPDSVDIHDVPTAMAKAQMSRSIAQTVIDRLTTGWSEITTMR